MALVYCHQCGGIVSDKAECCPHCGFQYSSNRIKCEDCGTEFSGSLTACPSCGCPVPMQFKEKKHTGIIIVAIIIVVVLAVGIIGLLGINARKKAEALKYYNNMETITYLMLDGAADAETAGNLIQNVWFNAIYEESDESTDKYTIQDGKFVTDFNDALSNLFNDEAFIQSISDIQDNQDEVTDLMKQLKNPPAEYEEAYFVLKTYYSNYLKMTNLIINPTGSLRSFSEDFKDLDTKTVESFDNMKIYLD